MRYENLLIKLAKLSSVEKARHGCVIEKGGNVLSTGFNKFINDQFPPYTTHAEIDAISTARDNLHGAILYILRIDKHGKIKYSKPCKNCMKAIKEAGIKKIIFSINENTYAVMRV